MACCGGFTYEEIQQNQKELDTIVRLACEYCHALDDKGEQIPPYAAGWWKRHRMEDDAREKRHTENIKREADRQSAIRKLTESERDALGI
jgi:hypothetical protein